MSGDSDLVEFLVQNLAEDGSAQNGTSASNGNSGNSAAQHNKRKKSPRHAGAGGARSNPNSPSGQTPQDGSSTSTDAASGQQLMNGTNGVNAWNQRNSQQQYAAVYPSNDLRSRDREWAEYVQFMNLPGGVGLHGGVGGVGDTSVSPQPQTGIPITAYMTSPEDGQLYNQGEADFVQSFVGNQQFFPPAWYFQHPGFTSQLYSDGRNVFAPNQMYPTYGNQWNLTPQLLPQENFADQQLAMGQAAFPYSKIIQQPVGDSKDASVVDPNDPNRQLYSGMSNMSLHEDQKRATNTQRSKQGQPQSQQGQAQSGPKSWAEIANTPAMKPPVPQPPKPKQPAPQFLLQKQKVEGSKGSKPTTVDTKKALNKVDETINNIELDVDPTYARFFVIKSYSEDDIHKAIKYNIWASTDSGNKRLDAAYKEIAGKGPVYLFFSVNASGQFCGMAQMISALDYEKKCELWAQDKWNGQFQVKWIFIKDIPNSQLRHIRLENNDNKPVTNSRDTQEILLEPGKEMLRIFTTFKSKTSILDDFTFYDKRQEQMKDTKKDPPITNPTTGSKIEVKLEDIPTGSNRTNKIRSPKT